MARQQVLFGATTRLGEVEGHFAELGELGLVGVDEAGRGPLAGPVVAAAVCLPHDLEISGLDDSKRLTAARREALFDEIQARARAWHIAVVEAEEIDRINILQATFAAMRVAIEHVGALLAAKEHRVDRVVIDGNQIVPFDGPRPWAQSSVVKGDQRSTNVAAASVLAKVHRDRILDALDAEYPQYGFAQHKGYPTTAHRAAIARFGPSPVHRLSFRGVREHVERPGTPGADQA